MPSICFICTANQFRSPIAAACLIRELAGLQPPEAWVVQSAGTWAVEDLPAPALTLQAAARLGLDGLTEHRTRQVTRPLLESFDLLVVMEVGHKEALASEFPSVQERLILLSEIAAGADYDIPDPALHAVDAEKIAREIEMLVKKGKVRLFNRARQLHRCTKG